MRKLGQAWRLQKARHYLKLFAVMTALLLMGGLATAAVLAADRNTISKAGELQSYPCGVDIFYKGAMLCVNGAGFAVPAADTAGYSAVIGVSQELVDNSSGSAGDLNVRVRSNRRFNFVATGTLVQGNVGETMYVVDDQTFNADQGVNAIVAGVLTEFVSTTAGYISIEIPAAAGGVGGVTTAQLTLAGRNEGTAFEAGDLLYVDGYDETEDRYTLALADADTIALAAMHLWTCREAVANNTNATFYKTFRETAQNTSSGTEGDRIYLSTTPGDWTRTTPQNLDPNGVTVVVGYIAIVSATVGEVEINLMAGGVEQFGTNEIQDEAITRVKLEEGSMVYIDVQLTNSEVTNFRATPITLIAAPGSNKAIVVHAFHIVSDDSNTAWTESSDNLVIEYNGGVDISAAITGSALVGAGTSGIHVQKQGVLDTVITPEANVDVQIFNTGSGEWGGGNAANTMSIRLWYSVVDTIAFT